MYHQHRIYDIGVGFCLGGIGLLCLIFGAVAAASLAVLVILLCGGSALLGVGFSYLFMPTESRTAWNIARGIIGLAYAAAIVYDAITYHDLDAILMGTLLVSLAIGYFHHDRRTR